VTVPSEFALFTDEVLPILRERGVVRDEYDSTTLRGNLGLAIPPNRYTVARKAGAAQPAENSGKTADHQDQPALI
jgi:hypothetical protein